MPKRLSGKESSRKPGLKDPPTDPTLPKQRIIPASISQSQESSQRPYSIQAGLKDPPKQLQHHEVIARIPKVEIIDIISAPPSPSVDIVSPMPEDKFQQKLHTEMFVAGKDGLERRKFLRYLCGYSEESKTADVFLFSLKDVKDWTRYFPFHAYLCANVSSLAKTKEI